MRLSRFLLLVLVALLLAVPTRQARAQEPDPTPTPTPAWQQAVQLPSGATLLVERRITYGEIAVVIAVLAVLVAVIIYAAVRIPKLWI